MKKDSLKDIAVSLRDFAVPSPRTGSLEPHAGFGRAALQGQEIHLRVQRERALSDPCYQAEVPVRTAFEAQGFRFLVEGRMDGIYRGTPAKIEEIKSTFDVNELERRLSGDPFLHPYALQLLTYGYIHLTQEETLPELSFHLVSSRNAKTLDLAIALDPQRYREWLDRRLAELVGEASNAQRRAARRRRLAVSFPFPFPAPRSGQLELMGEIDAALAEKRPLLLQAPTGLGKTVGVLYPALREALSRGQRVVYLTPKNSLHAVAEEAVARFTEVGAPVKSLSITAKGKICPLPEPLCAPQSCEYARDYHDKLRRHDLLRLLAKKRRLNAATFKKAAEAFRVCPFELQLDLAAEADVVICDYNYVFAPRCASARIGGVGVDQSGKPTLVIDEAHNLPARAMEQYSPALSSTGLEALREGMRGVPGRFRRKGEELLDGCLQVIASCAKGRGDLPVRIDPPVGRFVEQDGRLRQFLSRYLESDHEVQADDPVLRLCYTWSSFVEALELLADPQRDEFFAIFDPRLGGGGVKITCCDASAMLKGCYLDYGQVIAFSATLKPFDYYARLSGLEPGRVRQSEFPTPFPAEKRARQQNL